MPLYKLTSKRLAKRQREDELGITEVKAKMREMGEGSGLESGSEDDDESGSESESESGEEGSEDEEESDDEDEEKLDSEDDSSDDDSEAEEEGAKAGEKRKRPAEDDASSETSNESNFPITLETAITQPIYPVAPASEEGPSTLEQACVLCPGKILKNDVMVKKHLASGSHTRSIKRLEKRLAERETRPLESEDIRDIVDSILDEVEATRDAELRGELPTSHPVRTANKKLIRDRRESQIAKKAIKLEKRALKRAKKTAKSLARKERRKAEGKGEGAGGAGESSTTTAQEAVAGPTPTEKVGEEKSAGQEHGGKVGKKGLTKAERKAQKEAHIESQKLKTANKKTKLSSSTTSSPIRSANTNTNANQIPLPSSSSSSSPTSGAAASFPKPREGKGRSPRTVRKEKKLLEMIASGTDPSTLVKDSSGGWKVGVNRAVKRKYLGGGGKGGADV